MRLVLNQLTKTFGRGHTAVEAVRGLSLEISAGRMSALTGPSGSGKTTLLNLAGGLDIPDSGRVMIGDTQISKLSETDRSRFRRSHIGIVFQQFNLLADLTAAENIELPLILNRVPSAQRKKQVEELLQRLDLTAEEKAYPSTLSGGEQQRVAVARAVITRPWVLLADEPTANLDSQAAARVMALLKDLHLDAGITVLLTTHDPVVSASADHVYSLSDGTLSATG